MRRLGVASLDNGAESPVYGEESPAGVGLGAPRYASNGGLVVSAAPAWLPAPSVAPLPAARLEDAAQQASLEAFAIPGQVSPGASRHATNYDMSVFDERSGRWYVKGIRASTQPMGIQ